MDTYIDISNKKCNKDRVIIGRKVNDLIHSKEGLWVKIAELARTIDYCLIESFNERTALNEAGGCSGAVVTTTEDMTPEEEEMELFAGFLKEGYPEDIAAKKAKQWLAFMKEAFDKDKK